jgi:hypothetical protein
MDDRQFTLDVLILPPPKDLAVAKQHALGLFLRIEVVQHLLPFLTDEEKAQAQAWLAQAEPLRQQLGGRLTWQENPPRAPLKR